jgi:hypothetical protein
VFLEFHFLRIWAYFSGIERIIFFPLGVVPGRLFRIRVARLFGTGGGATH